jgi:hypothetical protein
LEARTDLWGNTTLIKNTYKRAIDSNFEVNSRFRQVRTDIYSEIVAICAATDLSIIDATGQIHRLSDLKFQADEVEHSPYLRQVNGAIKGLRLISGNNALSAAFYTWTARRVCFYDDQHCIKTIDLEDSGGDSPDIDCATFCAEKGLLIIGDNFRTLR